MVSSYLLKIAVPNVWVQYQMKYVTTSYQPNLGSNVSSHASEYKEQIPHKSFHKFQFVEISSSLSLPPIL